MIKVIYICILNHSFLFHLKNQNAFLFLLFRYTKTIIVRIANNIPKNKSKLVFFFYYYLSSKSFLLFVFNFIFVFIF